MKMKVIIFLLLDVILLFGGWSKLPGPLVSEIWDIAFDPYDSLSIYAGTDNGVWGSTDGGVTGDTIGPSGVIIHHVEVCRQDTLTVIYGGNSNGAPGLYRSRDNGKHWDCVISGLNIYDIEIDKEDPYIILATTGKNGVYRSEDGGDNWELVLDSVQSFCIKQAPDDVNFFYLYGYKELSWGYERGIYRSEDRGKTWTLVGDPYPLYNHPQSIYVLSKDTLYINKFSCIERSTDRGETWHCLTTRTAEMYPDAALAVDPFNINKIFTFKRIDFWSNTSIGFLLEVDVLKDTVVTRYDFYSAPINVVKFSPHIKDRVYLGSTMGLFISDDGGATWDRVNVGFSSVSVGNICRDGKGRLWAATGMCPKPTGIYMSEDNGKTWELRNPLAETGIWKNDFLSITAKPDDPDWILAGNTWTGEDVPNASGIFLTKDAGKTWECVYSINVNVKTLYFYSDDPQYVVSNLGYSMDGGQTWETWKEGDTVLYFNDISVFPSNENLLLGNVSRTNYFYITFDRGETWDKISYPGTGEVKFTAIDFENPGRIYLNTEEDGAYVSDDTGKTWQKIYEDYGEIYVDPFDTERLFSRIWGTYTDEVWISVDKGLRWHALPVLEEGKLVIIASIYIEEENIYVNTTSGVFYTSREGIEEKRKREVVKDIAITEQSRDYIEFEIGITAYVDISLYDVQGRKIGDIYSGYVDSKRITYDWRDLSKGVYFIRAEMGDKSFTEKVVKIR